MKSQKIKVTKLKNKNKVDMSHKLKYILMNPMWLGGETMLQKNHTTGSIPDDSKFYLIILIIKF